MRTVRAGVAALAAAVLSTTAGAPAQAAPEAAPNPLEGLIQCTPHGVRSTAEALGGTYDLHFVGGYRAAFQVIATGPVPGVATLTVNGQRATGTPVSLNSAPNAPATFYHFFSNPDPDARDYAPYRVSVRVQTPFVEQVFAVAMWSTKC